MQLDADTQKLAAFTIPGKDQFHWITSPMGLLEGVLHDIKNVLVYIDDLLVHTDTHEISPGEAVHPVHGPQTLREVGPFTQKDHEPTANGFTEAQLHHPIQKGIKHARRLPLTISGQQKCCLPASLPSIHFSTTYR
jgi:hypothetical protein